MVEKRKRPAMVGPTLITEQYIFAVNFLIGFIGILSNICILLSFSIKIDKIISI